MKIVLTGGSGDLGQIVTPILSNKGYTPVVLDVCPPKDHVQFVNTSITERTALKSALSGNDMVVHIAAWHGVHEFRKEKNVYDFWDVNVTGTFNVFQAAVESNIKNIIFISSTSIDDRYGLYGHTKVLGEEIARTYAHRHEINVLTLRPRAFIPHWNRTVYSSYVDWAKWFWKGAVHIDDVAQALTKSVELLASGVKLEHPLFLPVDGAYEYTEDDLLHWDKDGPGTTFKKYYPEYYNLAIRHGLDPLQKPKKIDITETQLVLGYTPKFSLKTLLQELATMEASNTTLENK